MRLQLLDYGRFFAAIAVVAFHYLFNGIHGGKISSLSIESGAVDWVKYGYLGVEFFFLISGYVIFFSARNRTPSKFAASRVLRLYPAFFVAVIITSLAAYFWGGDRMSVTIPQVLANFTMIPGYLGYSSVDGVYWTLVVEIKFYLLVFAALLVGLGRKLEEFFIAWTALMGASALFGVDGLPYMGGYFTYFITGAMFAVVNGRRDFVSYSALGVAGALALMTALGGAETMTQSKGVIYSPWIISGIVVAMFAFFVALSIPKVANMELLGSRLAGGITYPLYLLHAHLGYMILSRFVTEEHKWLGYFMTFTLVFILAYFLHAVVERRYGGLWKSCIDRFFSLPARLTTKIRSGRESTAD